MASIFSAPFAIVVLGVLVLSIGIGSGVLLGNVRRLEFSAAMEERENGFGKD